MPKKEKSEHFERSAGLSSVTTADGPRYISYVEFSAPTSSTDVSLGSERRHASWWKYRAERDREPFTYNKTRAQLQWNEVKRLQREHYTPVKDFYEIGRTYRPGANPKRKQNVNYIYGKYEEEKTTIHGDPADGIYVEFYTQSVDDDYELPFKAVDDGLDQTTLYYVDPKRKMPMRCYDGTAVSDPEKTYYRQERLPFAVFSSSAPGSYDLTDLEYNISLENMHLDSYGEIPLQGPWPEKNVGGYQYRHGQLLVTESNERSEGYRIAVEAANNLILVSNPRFVNADYDPNKPVGKYTRGEYAKRPVNIRNIRTVSASASQYHSIGNYSSSYEIVQTSGRDINNRYITRNGTISVVETVSPHVSWSAGIPITEYERLDRTDVANSHVFVERFSAPGGILESSTAYLDIESGQYSPYNALPWRNYDMRRALDVLYTRHSLSGGYDSSTPTSASFHKTPRNTLRQPNKFYAGPDHSSPIAASASVSYDNWFVSRQIPRTELQYSWVREASAYVISSSLIATTASIQSDLVDVSTLTSSAFLPWLGYDYSTGAEDISFVSKSEGTVIVAYHGASEQSTLNDGIDFVGMNTIVAGHIDITGSENILSSGGDIEGASGEAKRPWLNEYIFLVGDDQTLALQEDNGSMDPVLRFVYQNYNGPYGYPSWKQLRTGDHPVARHLRESNVYENQILAADVNGKSVIKRYRINQTPITTKHSPTEFNLVKNEKELSVSLPFGNKYHFFTKDVYDQESAALSDFNDEFGINPRYKSSEFVKMADEPWTTVNYSEVVFPRDENVGKSHIINRPTYESFWNNISGPDNSDSGAGTIYTGRIQQRTNSQGVTGIHMSSWPMEVITGSAGKDSEGEFVEYSGELMRFDTCYLPNTFGVAASDPCGTGSSTDDGAVPGTNVGAGVGPRFGRFYGHCRPASDVTNNRFPNEDGITVTTLTASGTPGLPPFPETYAGWSADISTRAKTGGYSILPEFKISRYIHDVVGNANEAADYYQENLYTLEVTGASTTTQTLSGPGVTTITSSNSLLLETYSHSDTIQNLGVVRDYYGEPDGIEFTMDIITKFRPEKEFYPVFRTLDLAQQFSRSYGKHADLTGPQKTWRTVLTPFYAPGIMYNSIRAGIAVDYPFVDMAQNRAQTQPTGGCHNVYENRMPFEAILEPANYAQKIKRFQFNPVYQKLAIFDFDNEMPSDSTGSIGVSNGIYEQMAHNFFAETIDFYTQNITTIKSQPTSSWPSLTAEGQLWNGGTNKMTLEQVANGVVDSTSTSYIKKFAMDVFLKKRGIWAQSTAPHWFGPFPYVQHVPPYFSLSPAGVADDTDFLGSGWHTVCYSGGKCCKHASLNPTMSMGENESYTRIVFDPTAIAAAEPERFLKGQFTLSDITNNSDISFVNVGMQNQIRSGGTYVTPAGAMTLSSSINIFSLAQDDRWTIAPKWQSIIRNYAYTSDTIKDMHLPSSSFPSVWQQQGSNFTSPEEGLFLQVKTPDLADSTTTGSLADICGFELDEKKIGVTKHKKPIQEGIAVIPFYTDKSGQEQFFNIPIEHFEKAYSIVKEDKTAKQELNSIVDLINKMRKYVMIPQFDFVKTRDKSAEPLVTANDYYKEKTMMPFAMYIFEATKILSETNLQNHWDNNVGANLSTTISESGHDATLNRIKISHPIKSGEMISPEMLTLAGFDGKLPSDLRFKIFKIKYRAQTNYYDTYEKYTSIRNKHNYQTPEYSFNWPYDYFSLIEMAKLKVTLQVNKEEEKEE